MPILTKDQILAADDVKQETVEVPEWGGSVIVRTMTALARDELDRALYPAGSRDMSNLRAKVVALSVVDEAGALVFSVEDAQALGQKSGAALDRVFTVAQRLSKLRKEDVEGMAGN